MSKPKLPAKVSPGVVVISQNNPFRNDVIKYLETSKVSHQQMEGMLASEKVTVTRERRYTIPGFAIVHKNRELLKDLTPSACKVMIHIALTLELGSPRVKISYKDIAMSRVTLTKALLELRHARIIIKEEGKKEWFWVNLTLIIAGRLEDGSLE